MRPSPAPARPWCAAGTILLLLAAPAVAVEGQLPGDARPILFEPVAAFATRRLRESSGIAVSRAHAGILWTHNDSGDGPFIYATNLGGADLGRFAVTGARAVDWEDIALGGCPGAAASCLYIADTGDNAARRRDVSVYIVPEPDPYATPRRAGTAPARRVVLKYIGGPRDVEAIAVTPAGHVLLISKGRTGPVEVFRLDVSQLAADSLEIAPWTALPIDARRSLGRLVTGAAVSPDGGTIVVRTYTELFFFALADDADGVRPRGACWLGLLEPQGEAVDYLDDQTLILTSEAALGRSGGISKVQCEVGDPEE
jgi:hypothetical protein